MRCTTRITAHIPRPYQGQGPSMTMIVVDDVSARGGGGPAT
jgi:hypothetical protein